MTGDASETVVGEHEAFDHLADDLERIVDEFLHVSFLEAGGRTRLAGAGLVPGVSHRFIRPALTTQVSST
jgi:hypothetical protein